MMVIIMHNNQEYLDRLFQIAATEDIKDVAIIKHKNIGLRLIGGSAGLFFSKGEILDAYEKAFVAVVKGRKKLEHFLNVVEHDSRLEVLNLQNRGFICAVPFHYLTSLELQKPSKRKATAHIKIADFLREDRIVLNMKASSKKEAINELAKLIKGSEEVLDYDTFLEDVLKREALISTGIGHNIAIPHARTDAVNDFFIVFGRSLQGIDFNSIDKKPAKLITLVGTPKVEGLNTYLRLLAQLARLLKKNQLQQFLLETQSPKEVIKKFCQLDIG